MPEHSAAMREMSNPHDVPDAFELEATKPILGGEEDEMPASLTAKLAEHKANQRPGEK